MRCPRIVIAGTHSGVGKTSLSLSLVLALKRRGLRVQTFKVGPDFLDPTYLALASGRPCYNLDGWMTDRDYVGKLFARVSREADLAVIEGVMGLYDGADPATLEGSTAEIAHWLDAPVILVVSAHGIARSLAAVVKGYVSLEPSVKIAGVIANRCGSESHAAWLAASLKAASLPALLGAVPRGAFPVLPSRHLGLITADDKNLPPSTLQVLADSFERYVSVNDILELARSAPPLPIPVPASPEQLWEKQNLAQRIRLGIAYDEAFHFYYQDLLDEMESYGCELIRFSPLEDTHLPESLDALYIGGGYPEEHAGALSANEQMLAEIRRFSSSHHPIYAECGGLMYLSRSLETLDEKQYALAGLLPVTTRMLGNKKSLGYVEITLKEKSLWGVERATLRGHEFHYSELTTDPTGNGDWKAVYALKRRRLDTVIQEGFQRGLVLASYAHLHLASQPRAIECFVANCR